MAQLAGRTQRGVVAVVALATLVGVAACGSASTSADTRPGVGTAAPASPAPNTSPGSMAAQDRVSSQPSPTAKLVCSDEIRHDIAETLSVASLDTATQLWIKPLFRCLYRTPSGEVQLLVQDSASAEVGTAFYDQLRQRLAPTQTIRGLAAFGLPAFETPDGQVVFLKDGKTLRVDTSGLSARTGPHHQTRTTIAYAIAADVIGCWSE